MCLGQSLGIGADLRCFESGVGYQEYEPTILKRGATGHCYM